MKVADLFGIGGTWSEYLESGSSSERQSLVPESGPVQIGTLAVNPGLRNKAETDALRDRFNSASNALRDALGKLERKDQAIFSPSWTTSLTTGTTNGTAARVAPADLVHQVVQTTQAVNGNTVTSRSSSSVIGLDVSSPEAASSLASSAALGLDLAEYASSIESTSEMNTGTVGSVTSGALAFTGTGTSAATLSGTYTGTGAAAAATSLTIETRKNATLSSSPTSVKFDIKDQNGTVIFSYSGNATAGQQISLGSDIGLSISFSAGTIKNAQTATTAINQTAVTVDANAAFNASAAQRPNFQGGAQVTAGSFTVNGTTIGVQANDSINSVLDRINNSGAGVTASVGGDRIYLERNSVSEDEIVLADDTSGFLAATKLNGANTSTGNIRDDQQALANTTQFGAVSSGSFSVNGVSIAIDKDTDSLTSVVDKINNAGAGVTASYNSLTDRIELATNASSEELTVGNDTTGFLAAAGLNSANTVAGNVRDDRQILSKTSQFSSVASGSFTVNGVAISVDASSDTFSSVVDRINNAGAGVTAAYDSATDTLSFTPDTAGGTVSLEDDTSGFLSAANVATGTAGTKANADGAFNATGVNGPLFETGVAVGAGTFTVNGVQIGVSANDTINSVLDKITHSAAGVTATYDAATETVKLRANESGASIALGADTSGFLAAVKLDGTASTSIESTTMSSFDAPLRSMTEYGAVTGGTLTVNGHQIAIDPATTTLRGLVSELNSYTDVDATLDETTGQIEINAQVPAKALTLSDTSGVLAALGIQPGTYDSTSKTSDAKPTQVGSIKVTNAQAVAGNVSDAISKLNDVLEEIGKGRDEDTKFQHDIEKALRNAVDALRDRGIRGLSLSDEGQSIVSVSRSELASALQVLDESVNVPAAISTPFDQFSTAITEAARWDEPAPTQTSQVVPFDAMRARLLSDQTATSLLLLNSSKQLGQALGVVANNASAAYTRK